MTGFDIFLIAMVAAFVLLRLRSELGNKTGNEPDQRFGGLGLGGDGASARPQPAPYQPQPDPSDSVIADFTSDPVLRAAYRDIRSADSGFDPRQFLDGARAVYPMILSAFWKADKDALKTFLSADVLDQFSDAIDARVDAGQRADNELADLSSVEVSKARLHGAMAEITVTFKGDMKLVTRDENGEILSGDPDTTVTVIDIWTFARNTRSDDPNWQLVATRSG